MPAKHLPTNFSCTVSKSNIIRTIELHVREQYSFNKQRETKKGYKGMNKNVNFFLEGTVTNPAI